MNHITIKHTPIPNAGPSRKSIWPRLIALLITAHVVGMVSAVVVATRSGPIGAEPRFYEKAVDWNATAAQRRSNQALGWIPTWAADAGTAILTLRDAKGSPIAGATGRVEFFHRAHANARRTAELSPGEPGVYTLGAALDLPGVYEMRLSVRRGDDVFTNVGLVQVFGR